MTTNDQISKDAQRITRVIGADRLTTVQAAFVLKRSPGTLYRWRRIGYGPPYYTLGGQIQYSAKELKEWWEKQRRQPSAA
jgi:predicted site-specific integrase-resolvase